MENNLILTQSITEAIQQDYREANTEQEKMVVLGNLLSLNGSNTLQASAKIYYKEMGEIPFGQNEAKIMKFYQIIREKYRNLNTVRSYLLGIKKIFDIELQFGFSKLKYNPVSKLENTGFIKIPKPQDTVKTLYVSKLKLDTFFDDERISERTKCIIHLLSNTGIRSSELLDLRKEDFEKLPSGDYKVNVYMKKVDRNRIIYLKKSFVEYLNDNINIFKKYHYGKHIIDNKAIELAKKSKYFLSGKTGNKLSRKGLDIICRNNWEIVYKNESIGTHQFRHFFITYKAIVEKLPIATVSQMVGHTSILTTMRYIHSKVTTKDFAITLKEEINTEETAIKIIKKEAIEIKKEKSEKLTEDDILKQFEKTDELSEKDVENVFSDLSKYL